MTTMMYWEYKLQALLFVRLIIFILSCACQSNNNDVIVSGWALVPSITQRTNTKARVIPTTSKIYGQYHNSMSRRQSSSVPPLFSASDDDDVSSSLPSSLPLPSVWSMSASCDDDDDDASASWTWERLLIEDNNDKEERKQGILLKKAALETWNWCSKFVVQYQLCPWAKASVSTPNALQIYLIQDIDIYNSLDILVNVTERFESFIDECNPSLESSAIFFCVFVSSSSSSFDSEKQQPNDDDATIDFVDFCNEFFDRIEPSLLDHTNDRIIAAPFHPNWTYNSNDDDGDDDSHVLDFEKQSPYPTISLVSADIVDRAGTETTEAIGIQNEEILTGKSYKEWEHLWSKALKHHRD